ncbi:MAG: DUF2085 domain-containing protein [Anaerolineae bacterium]|nr:DUF2085 domain-containing protein [Anaerolineae bacterium]
MGISSTETPSVEVVIHPNTYSKTSVWIALFFAVIIIGAWLLATPAGVLGKADAVGYAICHRITIRSFEAFDRQLPLCARCTGIYLGVVSGLMLLIAGGRSRAMRLPNWRILIVLGLFVVVLGIDGFNSYFHLFPGFKGIYSPNNTLRLITGVFTGLTFINLLLPIFNSAVWAKVDNRAPLENFKELAGMCLVACLVIAAALSERSGILLIFGVFSTLGVVTVLTMICSVMALALMQRNQTYVEWRELWLPLLIGLTIAITMIGGIDFLRYMFTGTWEGFNIDTSAFLVWRV